MSGARRPPDFLATPYSACTVFQSQSTELVLFSPATGEYVTIAWWVNYNLLIVQVMDIIDTGQPTAVVEFNRIGSRSGYGIEVFIGHASVP